MNAADPQKTWRKAVALINCDAGAAAKRGQRNLAKEITSACLAKNIHVGVVFAADREISNNLKLALDKAKAGEIDIVMVGGGDGTISSAAHLFARTEIPLGVMSLGTLNHFARDIGIPSAVDEAIATIAEGATRRVDVGTANGRTFINNSSIGAYPYIVLRRDQLQKRKRLSKWLAMSIAVFRVASRFRIKNLSLTSMDTNSLADRHSSLLETMNIILLFRKLALANLSKKGGFGSAPRKRRMSSASPGEGSEHCLARKTPA